jgi:hypothetical protein
MMVIHPIPLSLRKGRKSMDATPKRRVATKKESTPDSTFPIKPNEKAHNTETSARYSIILIQ